MSALDIENARLSFGEKFSYGFANFGINLLFGLSTTYLMFFYTDVFGVGAAVVGTVFLVARCVDGVFDPILGIFIDRTRTRMGRHRPYLAVLAIPYALSGIAIFWTPDLEGGAKIAYVFVTYTIFSLLYSGMSLPLNSMLPSLTKNPRERTLINGMREFLGTGGAVGVSYVALSVVAYFGGGDQAKGFLLAAAAFGAIMLFAVCLMVMNTRERIIEEAGPKPSARDCFSAIRGNRLWLAMLIVNLVFWVGMVSRMQTFVYYARDVLQRGDVTPNLMLTILTMVVGIAVSPLLALRIGKQITAMIGFGLAAVAVFAITGTTDLTAIYAANVASFFGLGLMAGVLFAMMADAVDHGEEISGVRAPGFMYAAISVGVKVGMSLGGAASAWLLASANYKPGAPRTDALVEAVLWGNLKLPAICFLIACISLLLINTGRHRAARAVPA